MEKILVLCSQSDNNLGLFNDIVGLNGVELKCPSLKRPIFKYVRKIVFSLSFLGIYLKMPDWIFENNIENWAAGCGKIVVRNTVLEFIPIKKIQALRAKGIKCILLTLESFDADSMTIKKTRHLFSDSFWDEIITFDPTDAQKHGWTYIGWNYYSKIDVGRSSKKESDVYFVSGIYGNRLNLINGIYSHLTANGVGCRFDILASNCKDKNKLAPGINSFRKSIPYREVLQKIQNSGCVLEILREGQHAPSLRYFEAIFYNKLLLTNNKDIVEYPLYDSRYMKVFTRAEDIDLSWLKSACDVDYHYSGEFSPVKLIEYLQRD